MLNLLKNPILISVTQRTTEYINSNKDGHKFQFEIKFYE